jgi:uncharacterized membrane protein
METYLLDWANVLLRWVHVITAIAWIGSSFYFVFLDSNLIPPEDETLRNKGVGGEMWAVHGGGFYNPQKYLGQPGRINGKLHWFYWESYSTWLSGFALFSVLYLWNAPAFLIDKTVMNWAPVSAGATAVALLAIFWLVYDCTCRWVGFRSKGELWIGSVMLLTVALACWGTNQLFAGRAAFLLVGAMMATAMSANVLVWIIPGQRKVVAAMTSGQPYDAQALAIHGQRGKQRSVHNTYFTLPVVFAMLSNHDGFLTAHPQRWLLLLVMMLAGALIRQFFVQRHAWHLQRAANPWPFAAAGVVLIMAVVVALQPASSASGSQAPVSFAQVQAIVEQRCVSCHGAQVQMKNLRLDSAEALQANAQKVYQQAVVLQQMPMNNATAITPQERQALARWFESGGLP